MKNWRPVDFMVAAITVAVCFTVVGSAAMPLLDFRSIDVAKSKLLSGVVGSMVSIISLYVGASIQEKRK